MMDTDDPIETVFRRCEALALSREEWIDEKFTGLAEAFAEEIPPLIAKARDFLKRERDSHEEQIAEMMAGEDW